LIEQQTTEKIPNTETAALEELKHKLVAFFKKYAVIAEQSIKKIRFMLVINIIAASWLTFYFCSLFHLSIISAMPLIFVMGLPALLLLKLYLTLNEVIGLPEQIQQIVDHLKEKTVTIKSGLADKLSESTDIKQNSSKIKDLFSMSKTLLDIKQVVGDAADLTAGFASALLLASPFFMILAILSTIITGLLAFLSIITGLFFIF